MKVFYHTFGCKVNQYETENIRESMEALGHTTVRDYHEADAVIINSCTVTSEADKKCRQYIHRVRQECPGAVLVCAGCMVQAHKDIEQKLPECDIIAGAHNKTRIPVLIEEFMNTGRRITSVTANDDARSIEPMSNSSVKDKTRSYIKISKPMTEIVSEAEALIAAGHKELILTGINLCCYGRENGGKLRLTDVIESLDALEGDFRIRLSSLEPELITDEDIKRWSACKRLCPQFHLSLQSGSNDVLKAMNRHYTAEEYSALCDKLRDSFEDCAITTDIMVGFPGESEENHRESLAFAERICFSDAHIFPYSRRPDTPADKLPGQLSGDVKKRRAAEMNEICRRSRETHHAGTVGKTVRVLFEKENTPYFHEGHSDNYTPVRIPRSSEVSMRRRFGTVLITGSSYDWCYGELLSDKQ